MEEEVRDRLIEQSKSLAANIISDLQDAFAHRPSGSVVSSEEAGDVAFDVDEIAERTISDFLSSSRLSVASFSEHSGLKVHGSGAPDALLLIDPIDGSRALILGLNSALISIAIVRPVEHPRFADIEAVVLANISTGQIMSARRGGGAWVDTTQLFCRTSKKTLERLFWATEVAGRASSELLDRLEGLIDQSSRGGAVFLLNSSAFAITSIALGRLDAFVDVAMPLESLGLFSYDIAAAVLFLTEAGGVCTLSGGESIWERPLFDIDGKPSNISLIAAASAETHAIIMQAIGTTEDTRAESK